MNLHRNPVSMLYTLGPRIMLATALMLSICDFVLAQPKPARAVAAGRGLMPYAHPGQLIDIGGRRINLHCISAACRILRSAASQPFRSPLGLHSGWIPPLPFYSTRYWSEKLQQILVHAEATCMSICHLNRTGAT